MLIGPYRAETATVDAAGRLATIRVQAMRPSLEAVGRFDEDRARQRFLNGFDPRDTTILWEGPDEIAGFFVVRQRVDHLYLDHLYIAPRHQGRRLGRGVIDAVKVQARSKGLPIKLVALNTSPAIRFYLRCGFVPLSQDALDTVFEWHPDTG